MKTKTSAIIATIMLLLFITATATGSGFVVPLFDSTKNFTATSLSQQPEIKAQLKPNLNTTNIKTQNFEIKPKTELVEEKDSAEKQITPNKNSSDCFALKENQKSPALKQAEIELTCQGNISTGGCTGLNCSAFQSIACSYCSSVNPSISHLSGCTPDSCPSGYFNQGIVCGPSGACNNCNGTNCDYDCANQMLECTRTCTTNPCTDPDYPNYCDGYCWSDCSSIGYYGGKCCNGSWQCCNSASYPELCCPESGDAFSCTTENDTCLSNGCSMNYPYKCNNKCWSCPAGTNLCCPSNGDPSYCCSEGQICQSNGTCFTPQTTANLDGYLKDHYGNSLQGITMRLTDCSDNTKYSDITESNGFWEMTATPGFYKLKTDLWWATYTWLIGGEECVYYNAQDYHFGNIQVNTETINYGYLKDEYENAWNNILVELTDCSDNIIISDTTDSSGYFYLKALKGNYKFKTHMPWGIMEWTINSEQCPLYHWDLWGMETITIKADTTVLGQITGHQDNPLQGVEAILAECPGVNTNSDLSDSQGNFSITAPKDYYKFQTSFDWGIINWNIGGKECNAYYADSIDLGTLPRIDTTIHGYFNDLDDNPLNGLLVELYDCSDNLIDFDTTSSFGYFSITNDAGKYQLKIVIEGYRIPLTNQEGDSCFVFFGDIELGTLNVNPTIDCSVFNNSCYNEDWRLFSCYFDSSGPSCVCYFEVCEFGCTEGQQTCNAGQQETIKIDVDNINDNYAPVSGAKIYLDNQFVGVTDSYGKKDVFAFPGFKTIKVFCPDNSFCSEKGIYLNSTTWKYFDCDCPVPQQTGDVIVDLSVISEAVIDGFEINNRPIAFADVYLDDGFINSTDLAGQVFLGNAGFGSHELGFFLCVEEIEGQDCQTKYGSINIDITQEFEVMKFGIYDYELFNNSELNVSDLDVGNRRELVFSDYNGEFEGKIAPLVVAVVVIGVAFIAWDIYDVYNCAEQYGLPDNEIIRWGCWDEVAFFGLNFIPIGGIISKGGKLTVVIGKKIKYLPEIGKFVQKTIPKVGKNAWKVTSSYADEIIEYIVKYTDDGTRSIKITRNAAGILLKNADEVADAVKIIHNSGDNFIKIGEIIINKGDIPGNAGNIQGKLGEIMTDEYIKKIIQNADEGVEIVVKSGTPEQILKETDEYIVRYIDEGKNIEIYSKVDGRRVAEFDRLIEINGKPAIIESKAGRFSWFSNKLFNPTDGKLDVYQKSDLIGKLLYEGNKPELILQIPKNELQLTSDMWEFIFTKNGKVIEFADDVSRFQDMARMLK